MAIKRMELAGKWVIKNLDGEEKRFDNSNSPAAQEWKNSRSSKKYLEQKYPKFSTEWWMLQTGLMPWSSILQSEDSTIFNGVKSFLKGGAKITDHYYGRQRRVSIDGVACTSIEVRCTLSYRKSSDLGLDQDTEDGVTVFATRDPKNPKKFNFSYAP
jgi:hypothetical protein